MDNDDRLARAFGYPYKHHSCAFNFLDGEAHELNTYSTQAMLEAGLRPVLGVGSNCAPEQLARKFAGAAGVWPPLEGHAVTVVPASLKHFDVVYAAVIASYGSIPATLQHSHGTTVGICVTFLGKRELARMHETEAVGMAYDFVKLSGLELILSNGEKLAEAWTYAGRHGCLLLDGDNIALAAMLAEGRRFRTMTQRELLERVWRDCGDGRHATLEEFVLSLIGDENRDARIALRGRFASNEFEPGDVTVELDNPA